MAHLAHMQDIERVVFLWDELPWMLEAIAQHNPQEAMELLDTLRALRQQSGSKLRMVFTGSLGLHHIVRTLQAQGYNNTPVNDMLSVEVEPLSPIAATDLVRRLLTDNGLQAASPNLYEATALALDCMPYYIHHVVSSLLRQPATANTPLAWEAISADITHGIHASDNPWDLQHYEERTLAYYGAQRAACLALLDAVASASTALSPTETIRRAKHDQPHIEPQQWLELMRLLERDHYFKRSPQGTLSFKFSVVKRWWVWHRGLGQEQRSEAV